MSVQSPIASEPSGLETTHFRKPGFSALRGRKHLHLALVPPEGLDLTASTVMLMILSYFHLNAGMIVATIVATEPPGKDQRAGPKTFIAKTRRHAFLFH